MPIRELKAKYGTTHSRTAINSAIRAEIAGGPEVLQRLVDANAACYAASGPLSLLAARQSQREAVAARDAMESDIRRLYGMPPLLD